MKFSRRHFLGGTAGGFFSFASQFSGDPLIHAELSTNNNTRRCIVLWMNGGPSQFETFDPKPGTKTGGSVGTIQTAVPGLAISEFLPEMSSRMDQLSVVRNLTSSEGEHLRAQYFMHTGYPQLDVFPRPSIGSILSYDAPSSDIPQYVSLGARGFGPAFLGPEHGPFSVQDPDEAREMLTVLSRRKSRLQFLQALGRDFADNHPSASLARRRSMIQQVERLVDTPFARALDVQQESGNRRAAYGNSEFGQKCLVARRLLESGVRFVEIQHDGWDTHTNNLAVTRNLCESIDRPWATLVDELEASGLLDETVVLWMGEFGRTPVINANAGRDHFPAVTPAVIGGAGLRSGEIVGKTTKTGREIDGESITAPDLFATILSQLGVDPGSEFTTSFGSPASATDSGTPIPALL